MEPHLLRQTAEGPIDREAMAAFIAGIQKPDGEIPWSDGGKTDPWDHVESAMGLAAAGRRREAERAYAWLAAQQLPDGSWWSAYRNGRAEDPTRETHFAAYVAVGVFHHYLTTGALAFVRAMWPTVEKGVNFAVRMQAPTGEIAWAKNREGVADPMALLTGSCSVFLSLKCALMQATLLGRRRRRWEAALGRLGDAIRCRPNLFNMMKSRFSMDWYYPVLCGAVVGAEARRRIDRGWDRFVVPAWGVRCVSDRPWVTIAETSELVLSLVAMGDRDRAAMIFDWILDKRYDGGAYWMGVTFPDRVVWPEERTSWTTAAVFLASEALQKTTPTARLFSHRFWEKIFPGEEETAPVRLPQGGQEARAAEAAL